MTVVPLDREALERARAIVARESPTPVQEARFRWTARLIVLTLVLLVAWVPTALNAPDFQQAVLLAAALSCLIANILFAWNVGFMRRLWRSYRAARTHGLHWRRTRRSPMEIAWLTCLGILHPFGWAVAAFGALAVTPETWRRDPEEWFLAVSIATFGVGLLSLLPLEIVRRRVAEMTTLRHVLDSNEPADAEKIQVPASKYDRITDLEFEQTCIDSHHSLENAAGLDSEADLAVSLSRGFQAAVADLPAVQADLVYDLVGDLDGGSELARDARRGEFVVPVPNLKMQIRVRRHTERPNEVEVISLEADPGGATGSAG